MSGSLLHRSSIFHCVAEYPVSTVCAISLDTNILPLYKTAPKNISVSGRQDRVGRSVQNFWFDNGPPRYECTEVILFEYVIGKSVYGYAETFHRSIGNTCAKNGASQGRNIFGLSQNILESFIDKAATLTIM